MDELYLAVELVKDSLGGSEKRYVCMRACMYVCSKFTRADVIA